MRVVLQLAVLFLALGTARSEDTKSPGAKFHLTLVDAEATGYATFQSHNQKVVAGPGGIFMTFIRTRNEKYTAQEWRLVLSTDGGASFRVIYEATNATNPRGFRADRRASASSLAAAQRSTFSAVWAAAFSHPIFLPATVVVPLTEQVFGLAKSRNLKQETTE